MNYRLVFSLLIVLSQLMVPAYALERGALLIDVSASMQYLRKDNKTRCQVAFETAEKSLSDFFDKAHGSMIKIFSFSANGQLWAASPGYVGREQAFQQLRDMNRTCEGNATALAEAICKVVSDLRSHAVSQTDSELALFLMTDGMENDSLECNSVTSFQPRTGIQKPWHQAVYDRVMTGQRVRVASLVFWPQADEIPDDFRFLKYLTIKTGSEFGGGLSNPKPEDGPGMETSEPWSFGVSADSSASRPAHFDFWGAG